MEQLTSNLAGKVRRATLHGREYLVAPLSLIVPGVLNGSKGPLYYPEDELARDPSAWNHIPIVVNHPERNGSPVSARDPEILEESGIGYVFNAAYRGKLIAEGWFDLDKTRRVEPSIVDRLERGVPGELSTGLFTDNVPTKGVFNSRDYESIARNHRPDHLAILPDKVGACSVKDGCGMLVNEEGVENFDPDQPRDEAGKWTAGGMSSGEVSSYAAKHEARAEKLYSSRGERKRGSLGAEKTAYYHANTHDIVAANLQNYISRMDQGDTVKAAESLRVVEVQSGYLPVSQQYFLRAYKARNQTSNEGADEMTEKQTLWNRLGQLFGITENSDSIQTGPETKCECEDGETCDKCKDKEDKSINNEDGHSGSSIHNQGEPDMPKLTAEQKNELLDRLVSNCACDETKGKARKVYETLNEDALISLKDTVVAFPPNGATVKPAVVVTNATPAPPVEKPLTDAEWLAKAPAGIRSVVTNAIEFEKAQKGKLIDTIIANERNIFSKEFLSTKELNELQGIAALIEPMATESPRMFNSPNYSGAAAPIGNSVGKDFANEDLDIAPPTINWREPSDKVA